MSVCLMKIMLKQNIILNKFDMVRKTAYIIFVIRVVYSLSYIFDDECKTIFA